MGPLVEHFLNEHRTLLREADILRQAGADAERRQALNLRHEVAAAYDFLFTRVVPLQAVEEVYLLPAVEHHLGSAAAAELRDDHRELSSLAEQLGSLRDHIAIDPVPARVVVGVERVLYAADELLRLHLMKEDSLLAKAEPGLFGSEQAILDKLLAGRPTA